MSPLTAAAAALHVANVELEVGPVGIGIYGGSPEPTTQDRWMERPDYYEPPLPAITAADRGIS